MTEDFCTKDTFVQNSPNILHLTCLGALACDKGGFVQVGAHLGVLKAPLKSSN